MTSSTLTVHVRALAVIGFAIALLAVPAAAQACERSKEGERYEARSGRASSTQAERTTVVLCDRRTGRERVLRRRSVDRGADSGVTFHSAAAAGRRLVWTEERRWRGRVRAVLVEARATDGSVFRNTELARNETGFGLRELDAVVTPGGTVATFVRVAAGDASAGQRLVLYRGGEEVREVTRGNLGYLGLEDGRTLRWTGGADRVYRDLNPPTRNNAGCPRRERFERILINGSVEVTEARYGVRNEIEVVRACLRETGRDRVVGQGSTSFGSGSAVDGPRSDGDWIALYRDSVSRYYGCVSTDIETLNLRTGQQGPTFDLFGCETPRDDEPDAITDTGVLAYVAQREGRWSVVAFSPGGEQLDTGPPGAITNLRADGSTLRWENAGQPRSAEIEPAA